MIRCDCIEDGHCRRYNRHMSGRMREICAGVNVDLGTAVAFRDQWRREAGPQIGNSDRLIPLLLRSHQAPGDAVSMTAAIYSLHHAHPGRYLTAVESLWPEVFAYNPDVVPIRSIPYALPVQMHYPAIHDSNKRGIHFMQGWCEFLSAVIDEPVPLLTNRPRLYFEDNNTRQDQYWLICSGGKTDLTNKLWGHHNYQDVVDRLPGVEFVQVGHLANDHPPLSGVTNLVGKTNLRDLFKLVRQCRGVVCGVSLLMHVAAALEKPAIVIAGGREPVQWNAYPRQHYIHTVGMLGCTDPQGQAGGACWRSRTAPLGDNATLDKHTCQRPIDLRYTKVQVAPIPECMNLIHSEEVANLVLRIDGQHEKNNLPALQEGSVP